MSFFVLPPLLSSRNDWSSEAPGERPTIQQDTTTYDRPTAQGSQIFVAPRKYISYSLWACAPELIAFASLFGAADQQGRGKTARRPEGDKSLWPRMIAAATVLRQLDRQMRLKMRVQALSYLLRSSLHSTSPCRRKMALALTPCRATRVSSCVRGPRKFKSSTIRRRASLSGIRTATSQLLLGRSFYEMENMARWGRESWFL